MGERYLTMGEIEQKYANQWVVIDRLTIHRRTHETTGGYVVFHSPSRDELDRYLESPEHFALPIAAILYMGPVVLEDDWEEVEVTPESTEQAG